MSNLKKAPTPERHKDGEEDGGHVVEQVAGPGSAASLDKLPVAACAIAQRTHGDVVPFITDLHTEACRKWDRRSAACNIFPENYYSISYWFK